MICISIWCITNPINHGIFTIPTGAPRIVKPSTVLQGVKKKNYLKLLFLTSRRKPGCCIHKKKSDTKMTHGIMALEKSKRRKLTIRETHRFVLKQYHWGTSPRIETFFRKVNVHMIFFFPILGKKTVTPSDWNSFQTTKLPIPKWVFYVKKSAENQPLFRGKEMKPLPVSNHHGFRLPSGKLTIAGWNIPISL